MRSRFGLIGLLVLSSLALSLTVAAQEPAQRTYDPSVIEIPQGYAIETVATGLNYPADVTFSDDGRMFVGEAGDHTYGTVPETAPNARIIEILDDGSVRVVYDNYVPLEAIREVEFGQTHTLPEGLIPPITGVTWHDGLLYVSHRSRVSTLNPDTGEFTTIIDGLPSWGFFHNYKPIFGPDGKMYFFLSSQGNAGPIDAHWVVVLNVFNKPGAHEIPCEDVTLTGLDFAVPVEDPSTATAGDTKLTGAFVPLGVTTEEGQVIEGQFPCNTAFIRADPDGSNMELVSWGFRSNFGYRFSPDGSRLVTTQNSGNPIPPREVHNDYEPIYEVVPGEWYGWPDFYSGLPITDDLFHMPLIERGFVLTEETHRQLLDGRDSPRQPIAYLQPHSAAEGMVFGREAFGIPENNILVAELGTIVVHMRDALAGFRVQRVNLDTGEVYDFLVNKDRKPASAADGGGLERPINLEWGPDGNLYVVDFGVINITLQGMEAQAGTGAIWRVTQTGEEVVLEEPMPAEEVTIPEGAIVVDVLLDEYDVIMPNRIPTGTVAFRVTNAGNIWHNFEVEGQGIERIFEHHLRPGETRVMVIENLPAGEYTIYCPMYDHHDRGMVIEAVVGGLEEGLEAPPPAAEDSPQDTGTAGVTDLASLSADLTARGAQVDAVGAISQPLFPVTGQVILLNGEEVQVFEFLDAATAEEMAAQVSPTGDAVGTSMLTWVAPPHFFQAGRTIVLYVGENQDVLDLLQAALGPQFAGG